MKKNKHKKAQTPVIQETTKDELKPWLPKFIICIILAIWAYIVVKNYYRTYPVNLNYLNFIFSTSSSGHFSLKSFILNSVNYFISVFFLGLIILDAFFIGTKIKKWMKYQTENILLPVGLGLGVIIIFVLIVGISGGLYKLPFLILFFVLAGLGIKEIIADPLFRFKNLKTKWTLLEKTLLLTLFLAGLITLLSALTPETFYDSQGYHLGVPMSWIQSHQIRGIDVIHQSYYTLNIHVLYTVALLFDNETLAKLIHWILGILSIGVIYIFGKKYFSRAVGLLAGTIFYTVPVVMFVFGRTSTELGLAFFELLAVFELINYIEKNDKKSVYLSAFFAGLALGGKYTSIACVVSLIIVLMINSIVFKKENILKTVKTVFYVSIIIFFVISPWLIKNTISIGNPFYPYGFDKTGNVMVKVKGTSVVHTDPPRVPFTIKNIFTVPWKITMGQKFQESFSGPVFLFLLLLIPFFTKISRITKLLFIYFVPYYLLWIFFGKAYLRYLIPALPVLGLILSYYLIQSKIYPYFRSIMIFVCILMFWGNLFFMMANQRMSQDPLGVVLGIQSKSSYLSTQRPTYPCPYYQTLEWANQNLPEDAKILFLGETRGYYSKRKCVFHAASDLNPIVEHSRCAKDGDELYQRLNQEEITHILFNIPETKRLAGYDIFYWEGKDLKVFTEFWNKYVKEIYRACADVTFNDGRLGSRVPGFWNNYIRNPKSYVYLYEIVPPDPEKDLKAHQAPFNFMFLTELHSAPRWKKIKPVVESLIQ